MSNCSNLKQIEFNQLFHSILVCTYSGQIELGLIIAKLVHCVDLVPQLCQVKNQKTYYRGARILVNSHLYAKFQDCISNGLVRGASTEKCI